jgi:hypothetical protein
VQDLREQLEAHVVTIETLRTERKKAEVQHEKVLHEMVSCWHLILREYDHVLDDLLSL